MRFNDRRGTAVRAGRIIGGLAGAAALVSTVACGAGAAGTIAPAAPQQIAAAAPQQPATSPVVVSCEPNQRTLVRPVVVNGAALSQVECVSADVAPVAAQPVYAAPARVNSVPVSYQRLPEARVVQTEQPVVRSIPARQVVYRDEEPVRARPMRSVAKSAVIIGSTAGASAGVGALIGGKKGALIGAAIGGGSAAVWDQVTRRK
jgi:hypothetical protein